MRKNSRLALISAFIIASLILISCGGGSSTGGGGGSDQIAADMKAVADDKAAIALSFATGDSAGSVTNNIVLPASGSNGSIIAWISDRKDIVEISGTVHRPDYMIGKMGVNLTAVLTKGGA